MKPYTEHLQGRQPVEIPTRSWPVVTNDMMKRVELGEPTPQDNPLVHSLIAGKVHLHNAILHTRRAALHAKDDHIRNLCLTAIDQIQDLLETWPLEVVP